jgi:molybdate transport system substrate-binding protein
MKRLLAAGLVAAIGALAQPGEAAEIRLFAGAGFKSAVDQIAPEFERKTGDKIVPVYGSEGGLTKRITDGESFDVLLIGASTVDGFIKQGKLDPATRKDVARAGVAVAVRKGEPKPDIGSVAAFRAAILKAKAIAYIGDGHSGEHFAEIMQRLGIADQVKPKLKSMPPAQVTKATANGETEWAVWHAPGINSDPAVELVGTLPAELQDYVSLSAGVSTAAANAAGGKALIGFLTSDAVPAIKAKGWQTAPY